MILTETEIYDMPFESCLMLIIFANLSMPLITIFYKNLLTIVVNTYVLIL